MPPAVAASATGLLHGQQRGFRREGSVVNARQPGQLYRETDLTRSVLTVPQGLRATGLTRLGVDRATDQLHVATDQLHVATDPLHVGTDLLHSLQVGTDPLHVGTDPLLVAH